MTKRHGSWVQSAVILSLVGLQGCGSDPTGLGPGSAGAEIAIIGDLQPDTIGSFQTPTVTIELRNSSGRPIPNVPLQLETPGGFGVGGSGLGIPEVHVFPLVGDNAIESAMTDAEGRFQARIRYGLIAGTAWFVVRAPSLLVADSIALQIRPGNPFQILLQPADTAVIAGRSYQLRGVLKDWIGNERPEPVSFTPESDAIAVTANGNTARVDGLTYDRVRILASAAGLAAEGWVSVVPQGTLAVFVQAFSTGDSLAIATIRTDGSGYTALYADEYFVNSGWTLDWAPDGQSLVFHMESYPDFARLYSLRLTGGIRRLIGTSYGGHPEHHPRHGADGWIYYSLQTDWGNGTDELWRVRADGTGPERIGPTSEPYQSDLYPSLSPDGTRMIFTTDRNAPGPDPARIAFLNVGSTTLEDSGVDGLAARWSPDGSRIAFVDGTGAIIVMTPEGGSQRVVSEFGRSYEPWIDWSPDGKWIVAAGAAGVAGVDIIEPDLVLTLPLAFAPRWSRPAWKP